MCGVTRRQCQLAEAPGSRECSDESHHRIPFYGQSKSGAPKNQIVTYLQKIAIYCSELTKKNTLISTLQSSKQQLEPSEMIFLHFRSYEEMEELILQTIKRAPGKLRGSTLVRSGWCKAQINYLNGIDLKLQ